MSPGFNIGPLFLHYYGLILAAAALTAFLVAKYQAKRAGVSLKVIEDLAIILILPTITGARLYHVLHFWDYYQVNLSEIFFIWQGGIGILGALISGIATLAIFSNFKKMNFLKLADIASPALVLAQSIGRVGNFFNVEGFGPPTNLPWGIYVERFSRPAIFANFEKFHPTFFYEALGNFLIFLILIFLPGKISGLKFAAFLILYSSLRFGLEFLRIDTWQIGIMKTAQVISIVGILTGFLVLGKILKFKWITRFSA